MTWQRWPASPYIAQLPGRSGLEEGGSCELCPWGRTTGSTELRRAGGAEETQGEGRPEAWILAAEGFGLAGKGLGAFWQWQSISSSEMLRSGCTLALQSYFLLSQTDHCELLRDMVPE